MLKIFIVCCLVALSVSPVLAIDSSIYPYVGVTAGTPLTSVTKLSDSSGSLDTDFSPGYLAGLCAGVTFDMPFAWNIDRIRTEVEIGYRSSDLKSVKTSQGQSTSLNGTVSVSNVMMNGYLENTTQLLSDVNTTLFLTAGVGAANASISSISYQGATLVKSASDTQLAYQGGLGAGFELTKNITLDASYKYMATTAFNFAGIKAEYGSHNILLGVRYAFK